MIKIVAEKKEKFSFSTVSKLNYIYGYYTLTTIIEKKSYSEEKKL